MPKNIDVSFYNEWTYIFRYQRGNKKFWEWNTRAPIACNIRTRRPIWSDEWKVYCGCCGEIKPRGQFSGLQSPDTACIDCRKIRYNQTYVSRKGNKPQENPLAYTHIIQNRYDKARIYKFHILQGDVPKGYTIIYRVAIGKLLPSLYRDYEVYNGSE